MGRFPCHYLTLIIDIELQILTELQPWKDLLLHHIEPHQDTKYPNCEFSFAVQLNIQADTINTEYLSSKPSPIMVPFLPGSYIQFNIENTTIKHHIDSQIHFFALVQPHWHYPQHIHDIYDVGYDEIV